jgi:hypothetical protein
MVDHAVQAGMVQRAQLIAAASRAAHQLALLSSWVREYFDRVAGAGTFGEDLPGCLAHNAPRSPEQAAERLDWLEAVRHSVLELTGRPANDPTASGSPLSLMLAPAGELPGADVLSLPALRDRVDRQAYATIKQMRDVSRLLGPVHGERPEALRMRIQSFCIVWMPA